MTSITSLSVTDPSSYVNATSATNSTNPATDNDAVNDASSTKEVHGHHHHHGGGGMGQALMQTMQQLGLTPPAQPTTDSSSTTNKSDASTSPDASTSATGNLRSDLGAFMAQLFQTLQADASSSGSSSSGDASNSTPGGRFAAALSSLTSEVANGSAPAGLQSAYAQLMSDFQANGASSNGSTSSSAASSSPTLQTFLSTLQQNLAHHGQNQLTVGNVVSTQA
ncbi:MAG: hypothetical protein JO006_19525 [Paucibacter sp.]|nr:hypothetical protein [Roseateles sp.]